MNEQISFVIEVQNIDMHLLKFKEGAKRILSNIEEIKLAINTKKERHERLKEESGELNKKIVAEEINGKLYDDRVAKMKDAQKLIQTNKEYNAMQKSIRDNEALKKKSDDDILSFLTDKDALNDEMSQLQNEINELSDNLAKKNNEYKEQELELNSVKKDFDDKKIALVDKIKKEYYAVYETIKKSNKLPAIIPVTQSGACTGCYRMLPPQQFNELLSEALFMQCPICSRILYVEKDKDALVETVPDQTFVSKGKKKTAKK